MLVQGLGEYLTSDEAFVRSKGKLTDSLLRGWIGDCAVSLLSDLI